MNPPTEAVSVSLMLNASLEPNRVRFRRKTKARLGACISGTEEKENAGK
jgi:hypothetical protein